MLNVLAVKAPGFGDRRKEMLRDIADPDRRPGHQRGTGPQARRRRRSRTSGEPAASSRPRTTPPSSRAAAISRPTSTGRIKQIKAQIEETTSDYDKEKLQERLAKLAGGVAIIKVGAGTEVELKEKKHRVEDALSATRAAVEEGIVPGGGVVLINAAVGTRRARARGRREDRGRTIVRRALEEPLRRSSRRTPASNGSVVLENVRRKQAEKGNMNLGYDVISGKYADMIEAGIIDPAKVTRSAVENAASIAAMVLTTEAMVTDKPEPKSAMPAMPPGGGMGDF